MVAPPLGSVIIVLATEMHALTDGSTATNGSGACHQLHLRLPTITDGSTLGRSHRYAPTVILQGPGDGSMEVTSIGGVARGFLSGLHLVGGALRARPPQKTARAHSLGEARSTFYGRRF